LKDEPEEDAGEVAEGSSFRVGFGVVFAVAFASERD
jgi:hypothetical protein